MVKLTKKEKHNRILDEALVYVDIYRTATKAYNAIQSFTIKTMIDHAKETTENLGPVIRDMENELFNEEKNRFSEDIFLVEKFSRYMERLTEVKYLSQEVASSFIVSFVTNFDRFLSNILSYIFHHVDGQILAINESVKFNEIRDCKNVSSVKDYYIEKFIDSFFRQSHLEQFKWLDEKLSLKIKDEMPNYDDFMFLCKLRNLIVHNNCELNDYSLSIKEIEKYKRHGFVINKKEKIIFNKENITFLYNTVYLSTTYLFSLISYKYFKNETILKIIEGQILFQIEDDLINNYTEFSIALLNNQLNCFNISSTYLYEYKITLCIAYKKIKNIEKLEEILSSLDLNVCDDRYIFMKSILLSDKKNVIKYMGKYTSDTWRFIYAKHPLCDEIRKEKFFQKEYERIFKEKLIS